MSSFSLWIAAHRSAVITATSGSLVAALVAAVAIVSSGYDTKTLNLGDASVWVTNTSRHAVGRVNTQIPELNTVIASTQGAVDVAQHENRVVAVDPAAATARLIDPATSADSDPVALPAGDPVVLLAGDRVVVHERDSGDVWFVPFDEFGRYDAGSAPELRLGPGAEVVVSGGSVIALAPGLSEVLRVGAGEAGAAAERQRVAIDPLHELQLAEAGDGWVVFDRTTGALITAERRVEIGDALPDEGAVLLQASSDDSAHAYLASSTRLLRVDLATSEASIVSDGHAGEPVAPITLSGCTFAAWGDGGSWRQCGEQAGESGILQGLGSAAGLVFRANADRVVLNDPATGDAWVVQSGNRLVENWDELLPSDESAPELGDTSTPPEPQAVEQAPVAVDDGFGARPGRTTVLPVLANDFDPNGDVLLVDEVGAPDASDVVVEIVPGRQRVRVTLPATATGELAFSYTISDGHGGTATAQVVVAVRPPEQNSPPAQLRPTRAQLALGARLTTNVLGDWFDPDGDAFYLSSADVAAPDTVTHESDGTLVYTDADATTGARSISTTVSDGTATGQGSVELTVRDPGDVPLTAEPFAVEAIAGRETTIEPLSHVRGGTGTIRLTEVAAQAGVQIVPELGTGAFRIVPEAAGELQLGYTVSDGDQSTTGVVRVTVLAPPETGSPPVTVQHTVFARPGSTVEVDVLAGDRDPAGGVLSVLGFAGAVAESLRADVLDRSVIRITLVQPLPDGSVDVPYRVSNGVAETVGTVTVVEIPEPPTRQPPIARADAATVRAGDAVDIAVLANDSHPDGDRLTLAPELDRDVSGGLLFVRGSSLRYLAPSEPGTFTAGYRVVAPDGQWATAEVTLTVRAADPAANTQPTPRPVTARVVAGETVRIPVPLDGIDPDGDSVKLLGQSSAPSKGVVHTGATWLEYTAGPSSVGTDTFEYQVVDGFGARGTGTVTVGVSPRETAEGAPSAAPDEVTVRPGTTILARVLDNDSDPSGGELRLVSVDSGDLPGAATVRDGAVAVVAPDEPGRYGFVYEIANARGGSATAFLTVVVDPDAALARPQVDDTVLGLADVLGREQLDVAVLDNVFRGDGPRNALVVSIVGDGDATVRADKSVRVQVKAQRQIIPFAVAHPDDASVVAYGFIWVPGLDEALPQLRGDLQPLAVVSGSRLVIPLADVVMTASGGAVRIVDPGVVVATNANGEPLVVDERTLAFTSAPGYTGPASISVGVADAADPARTATLVIPVVVTPAVPQPPAFAGGTVELEPGQRKTVDLRAFTVLPVGDEAAPTFTIAAPPPGFGASLSDGVLTVSADTAVPRGGRGSIAVEVRDADGGAASGTIELVAVGSSRPLAAPVGDTVVVERGSSATIDLLANDTASNPFPGAPLTVTEVRGADAASLPPGVVVTPSADRSQLRVEVAADARVADAGLRYGVMDATGDPARVVWGTVRISVQDRPGPITGLRLTGTADRQLMVAFSPGPANNSPIAAYEVSVASEDGAVLSTTECRSTSCAVTTLGNGVGNRVLVSVAARNRVGLSDPVSLGQAVWSDVLPEAVTALTARPGDGRLQLSWNVARLPAGASAVRAYLVRVDGRDAATVAPASCAADVCSTTVAGLQNGVPVSIVVVAQNDAFRSLAVWPEATITAKPFGAPAATAVTANGDDGLGTATLSWAPFGGNGDSIRGYFVQSLGPGGTVGQACGVVSPPSTQVRVPTGGEVREIGRATTATFDGITQGGADYRFVVWGYNQAGCVSSEIVTVTPRPAPGPVTSVTGVMADVGTDYDYRIDSVAPVAPRYEVQRVDAAGAPVGEVATFSGSTVPRALTGGPFGEVYGYQLRACNVWGDFAACGPWAAQKAPAASITFELAGLSYAAETGEWTWTALPHNGSAVARFRCGSFSGTSGASLGAEMGCRTEWAVAPSDAWIQFQVGRIIRQIRPGDLPPH
ncbi:Ig-like domain-containing protein [Compostimonas suwonensis]|uniref:Ig-like domain-containing protein n=1 Tax=Compostimonas suwonensis TaxID=1048394 RepID=UPI0012FDE218|nr:Ig-like domain-containing protein [Compostimonas suwonensis]